MKTPILTFYLDTAKVQNYSMEFSAFQTFFRITIPS